MRPMSARRRHARTAAATLAAFVGAVASVVALFWADVFDAILAREMRLAPDSAAYSEWLAPSLPLYFDVYLFNWTNADRLGAGERPHVRQLGPYRYRERREKVQLVWHAGNASVSYRTRRTWHFEPAQSNGSLDDVVTTLNVVAASAVYRARHWNYLKQRMLSIGLGMYGQEVWARRTAAELLFDGYEHPLIDMARSLPAFGDGTIPPFDRFGWFYKRNGSLDNDGHLTVSTGSGLAGLAGQIRRWNYAENLPHLPARCSQLAGSLGEFFPRRLGMGAGRQNVTLFSPDLCRPLPFTREQGAHAVHDVPAVRYSADAGMLDNGTLRADNACYCGKDGADCVPAGALNVSACRFGSPAFVSLPHFYLADPSYRTDVAGLDPRADRHAFYLDIEPTSGVPLDVAARFQLNILVAPNPNIALYAQVPRLMFPVLWVEQRVVVDEDTARLVGRVRSAAVWGGVGFATGAAVAFALSLAVLASSRFRRERLPAPAPPELEQLCAPTVGPATRQVCESAGREINIEQRQT